MSTDKVNARRLVKRLREWVTNNRPTEPVCLRDSDRIWENYPDLGEIVCDEVGWYKYPDEDEEE